MTINKSQGQTLQKVGISLKLRRFSATDNFIRPLPGLPAGGKNMTLAIPDNLKKSRLIKNVVWRQVLEVL
jgi:hypothetical protein